MKIYLGWLIALITWNYGVPNATPTEDVVIAVFLSFLSIGLKKVIK